MPPHLRRLLAIGALLLGLLAAWWQSKRETHQIHVAWLLTHVTTEVDAVLVDRANLTDFGWHVPGTPNKAWTWRHFDRGEAPDSGGEADITLAADVTAIDVACRFQLTKGGPLLRTKTQVPATAGVIDVGPCGAPGR